jgi:hypothetical protein
VVLVSGVAGAAGEADALPDVRVLRLGGTTEACGLAVDGPFGTDGRELEPGVEVWQELGGELGALMGRGSFWGGGQVDTSDSACKPHLFRWLRLLVRVDHIWFACR